MTRPRTLATVLLALLLAAAPARADTAVDLELVLAVDVSGSIDPVEARLQRRGYLAALTSQEVLNAITGGFLGRVAIAYFEWAGARYKANHVDWHVVETLDDARRLAKAIDAAPPSRERRTSISAAIEYAMPLFDANGIEGTRRVIDISGDGPNNGGLLVTDARDWAVAQGVTINGLPIVNDRPNRFGIPNLKDLDRYYVNCVTGGLGAFVVVAEDFHDFARAIRKKLVLEIAGAQPRLHPASAFVEPYASGCDIGERMLEDYMRGYHDWP